MRDAALASATEIVASVLSCRAPKPDVASFFDPVTFTATHLVSDTGTGQAAIIDSVLDFDPASGRTATRSADGIIASVRERGLKVEWILETHAHADHLSAAPYLKEALGGQIAIGNRIVAVQETFGTLFNQGKEFARDGSQFDRLFADGDRFRIGGLHVSVLHVPGHTPADIAYVVGDAAFIGDTLFMPDYGTARTDFPGGDAAMLFRSIRRLLALPPETRLFTAHDYKAPGRDHYAWESSVAEQRARNVDIHDGVDEEAFVAMRRAKDAKLAMPTLILPSVQVN